MRGENHGYGRRIAPAFSRGLLMAVSAGWLIFSGMVLPAESAESRDAELVPEVFLRYCAVCHGPGGEGDGPNAGNLDPPPRDLTSRRYMRRLTKLRIRRTIFDGGAETGKSPLMPPFGKTLPPKVIDGLAAYVKGFSKNKSGAPAKISPAERGAQLVGELGCAGCHNIPGQMTRRVGPELTGAGSKLRREWVVPFLRSPKKIRPVGFVPLTASRMPDFGLSQEEAEALTAFLMTLGAGEKKDPGTADRFQNAGAREKGAALFLAKGCAGCHRDAGGLGGVVGPDLRNARARLKPRWIVRWLQNPQAIDPGSKMPNIGLKRGEAVALTAYIMGLSKKGGMGLSKKGGKKSGGAGKRTSRPDRVRRGRELFTQLGCWGCHRVRGYTEVLIKKKVGADLQREGNRVRRKWLDAFLRKPYQIRPRYRARMPNFHLSDKEAGAVGDYLMTLKDPALRPLATAKRSRGDVSRARLHEARHLIGKEIFECVNCHPWGEKRPEGDPDRWGPDLSRAHERLQPDWVYYFLASPQRVQPGTDMPEFFTEGDELPKEIAGGDRERALLLLRDLLGTPFDSIPKDLRK